MAIENIIIMIDSVFNDRDLDRFGIKILEKYFHVVVLDCAEWLKPHFQRKHFNDNEKYHGCIKISSYNALMSYLRDCPNSIVIDQLGVGFRISMIRRSLKNIGIYRAIIHNGLLPAVPIGLLSAQYAISILGRPLLLIKKISSRLFRQLYKDPTADIVLMSGEAGESDGRISVKTHKIWAHSFDYDLFLRSNSADTVRKKGEYAIFLDEDIVNHSDYDYLKIRSPVTEDVYFPAINRYFEAFEKLTNLVVIIAAHPKSNYQVRPGLWQGREVVYGSTADLVRNAKVVICHQSTAISFAVMWRKALIFLTSKELNASFLGARIKNGSKLLDSPLASIDDINGFVACKDIYKINEGAYRKYVESYIKRSNTPSLPFWEIFSKYVRAYL